MGAIMGFPSPLGRPGQGWGRGVKAADSPALAHRCSWTSAHRRESHTRPQGPRTLFTSLFREAGTPAGVGELGPTGDSRPPILTAPQAGLYRSSPHPVPGHCWAPAACSDQLARGPRLEPPPPPLRPPLTLLLQRVEDRKGFPQAPGAPASTPPVAPCGPKGPHSQRTGAPRAAAGEHGLQAPGPSQRPDSL